MRLKVAVLRVLCKLGWHVHRVTGHTDEEKPEYYYCCVFCTDSFWDYAIPDNAMIEVEEQIARGEVSEWVPLE